jgi:hypothetical protein
MAESDLFEEMLATYPAEKRELARKVYQRFADGDSTQFFTQLLLVLDVYARYVERIPKAAVQANQESFAILEDMRGEIAMIAKTIEARDVNITNHATKTDELCKITQAKCDETIASVELMVKNLGAHMDTKAIVQGIKAALDKGIKDEIISPFVQHSKELGEQVLPALKQIKEVSTEAHTLWMKHIWKTAWAGSFMVTFLLFGLGLLGFYHFFDNYAEREAAGKIAEVERVMNYNQEAFQQLAIAQVPIHVTRTQSYGVANPQNFALVVEGADSAEMRQEDGKKNGYIFVSSHLPEDQIQSLQQEIDKLTQITNSSAK